MAGNTGIIGKTDVGKHAILSHFPMMKTPNSNSRSKHTLMRPVLHLLRLIPVSVPCSVNLLRGQSSSACFPPANRPVERSKFFPAMRPAVRHPNRIYKQRFMKNADAKLQAPHYLWASAHLQFHDLNFLEMNVIARFSSLFSHLCIWLRSFYLY